MGEQSVDSSLNPLLNVASSKNKSDGGMSCYFMQDGLLCRQWVLEHDTFSNTVLQVVVPCKFRKAVVELGHKGVAGHMEVQKTYDRIVHGFSWPGLKTDVSFYASCHGPINW